MEFDENTKDDPELKSMQNKTQKGEDIIAQSPRNWGKIATVVLGVGQ